MHITILAQRLQRSIERIVYNHNVPSKMFSLAPVWLFIRNLMIPKLNLEIILQNTVTNQTQKEDLHYSGPTMPDSRLSILGSSPGWGHCLVFLGNTLYSYSASLNSGVEISTGTCSLLSLLVDSGSYFLLFLAT